MKKQVKKIIICLLLVICCLCGALIGTTNNIIYAISNATKYTNVLYDLQSDENFDASDYVVDDTDYSLQVIQIAESNEKELFVYVYQPYSPNEQLKATSINISKGIDENLSYRNYTLTLLNSNGVFYKYKVDNFVLETTETRYYDISSIFRKWNANYDESPQNENTISEVSFAVSQQYTFTTNNGVLTIDCTETEYITITDKYVGFVRYDDGYSNILTASFHRPGYDCHFIAFNTNREIDKLLEADVYFTQQSYSYSKVTGSMGITLAGPDETYGEIEDKYSYLTYDDRVELSVPHGARGNFKYSWNRIQTVNDFVDCENMEFVYSKGLFNSSTITKLTQEGIEDLEGKQWVLRFTETEFHDYNRADTINSSVTRTYIKDWSIVGNVSILRLKFDSNGRIYNLGVIDNKQSGDGIPDNYSYDVFELGDFLKILLAIFFAILLIVLLSPFLPQILNFIWWFISSFAKGIWAIVSFPFMKIKENKNNKTKNKKGGGKK